MATNVSTIGTTSRNYSTITAWEAAVQGDLVTAGDIEKGECYDDSDFNEAVRINGSTTDASNYVWLTAASGEEHDGTHLNGVINDRGANTGAVFLLDDTSCLFENIIVKDGSGTVGRHVVANGDNCIIRNIISYTSPDQAFAVGDNFTGVLFINCIAVDSTDRSYHLNAGASASWYNCLAYSSADQGFSAAGTATTIAVVNCISMANIGDDFDSNVANESYNISGDATATGTGSLASRTATANASPGAGDWVIFTNISAGTEDFHLQDNTTDNDAQDAGSDVSGTTGYSLDIDLETRIGTWDIGPDEFAIEVIGGGLGLGIEDIDAFDNVEDVTPDDSNDLTKGGIIFIGTGGNIKVDFMQGGTVTFLNVSNGKFISGRVKKVYSTGTTASDLIVIF